MNKFDEYRTIIGDNIASFEVKKSTFIGSIKACKTEEQAIEFIEEIRKEHRQATHNCYAYIIGPDKLTQRYSDDGEPQGTAGIPMLEVLKKEDLTNICVVVTRYYGGVKLGASGLIRAYSKGVSHVLESSDDVWMRNYRKIDLSLEYTLLGKIDNYLINEGIHEITRDYTDKVSISLYIASREFEKFNKDIQELTSATAEVSVIEDLLLAERERK